MGHWGWRPVSIVICICVWIVGCTDQHDEIIPTRTPTIIPQIRLLLRPTQARLSEDDPALPIVATLSPAATHIDDRSASASASTLIPTYPPISITVHPPTCYESTPGGVVCYGLVENHSGKAVGRVDLRAILIDPAGRILREQTAALDQRVVPAGGLAPYRVLFSAQDSLYLSERFGGIGVNAVRVEHIPEETAHSDASVELLNAQWDDQRYRVQARVHDRDPDAPIDVRVVITLLDAQNRVTGYRVMDLADVAESADVDVVIDTQVQSGALQVLLYAERLNP
jgi:hypothetical protein